MSGDSLLDLMMNDHTVKVAEKPAAVRRAEPMAEQQTSARDAFRESKLAASLDADRAEARQKSWQSELAAEALRVAEGRPIALAEMHGLREGMVFDLVDCDDDINGRWVVKSIDRGDPSDPSRQMTAMRVNPVGGDIKLENRQVWDLKQYGILKVLGGR